MPTPCRTWARALHDRRRYEEAIRLLEKALRLKPDHADALYNLGNVYRELGRYREAVALYRKAAAIRPDRADIQNNLGNALLAERLPAEAEASFRRAVALDPGLAQRHLNLGTALAEQERVEEAAASYSRACQLRPEKSLWAMKIAALCPVVFEDNAAIDRYRVGLEAKLDAFRGTPLPANWDELVREAFIPSFNLSHHGREDRRIKEKFAALFEGCFPTERPRLRAGKPRIGFVVTRNREAGFLRTMGGIVPHLDPARFEAVVLCSQGGLEMLRQGIRRADVTYVTFPGRLSEAAQRIREAQCAILYHRQIGTDPFNYFLPFPRSAPVQCASWGTHVTSGIRAVDYYLCNEPPRAGRRGTSLHRDALAP